MSLIHNGPHTVIVYPMIVSGRNKYGEWSYTRGEGISVEGCTVQNYGAGSLSGLESEDETSINDQKVIRGSLPWPGGVHSIVEWEGVEYDQKGLPKEYGQGVRTNHFLVRIKRRSAEVK